MPEQASLIMLGGIKRPIKTKISCIALGLGLVLLAGCNTKLSGPPKQHEIDAYLSAKVEAVMTADYENIRVDDWSRLSNPGVKGNVISYTFRTLLTAEKTSDNYFGSRIDKVREMHCDKPEDIRMMDAGVEYFYTVMTSDDVILGTITANTEFCKAA